MGRNVRGASCSFSPPNSCFDILSGLLGSAPEQRALSLPSPELHCLPSACAHSVHQAHQNLSRLLPSWLITERRASWDRAAMEDGKHTPGSIVHQLSRGEAALSEAVGCSSYTHEPGFQFQPSRSLWGIGQIP